MASANVGHDEDVLTRIVRTIVEHAQQIEKRTFLLRLDCSELTVLRTLAQVQGHAEDIVHRTAQRLLKEIENVEIDCRNSYVDGRGAVDRTVLPALIRLSIQCADTGRLPQIKEVAHLLQILSIRTDSSVGISLKEGILPFLAIDPPSSSSSPDSVHVPLPNLKELSLSECGLVQVGLSLGHLVPFASVLNLSHNHLEFVEGLQHMTELSVLDVGYNRIAEVASLAKCLHPDNLAVLILRHNGIRSVSGLERLLSLQSLDLSENLIDHWNELSILVQLPKLRLLWLGGNPIAKEPDYRPQALELLGNNGSLIAELDGIPCGGSANQTVASDATVRSPSKPVLAMSPERGAKILGVLRQSPPFDFTMECPTVDSAKAVVLQDLPDWQLLQEQVSMHLDESRCSKDRHFMPTTSVPVDERLTESACCGQDTVAPCHSSGLQEVLPTFRALDEKVFAWVLCSFRPKDVSLRKRRLLRTGSQAVAANGSLEGLSGTLLSPATCEYQPGVFVLCDKRLHLLGIRNSPRGFSGSSVEVIDRFSIAELSALEVGLHAQGLVVRFHNVQGLAIADLLLLVRDEEACKRFVNTFATMLTQMPMALPSQPAILLDDQWSVHNIRTQVAAEPDGYGIHNDSVDMYQLVFYDNGSVVVDCSLVQLGTELFLCNEAYDVWLVQPKEDAKDMPQFSVIDRRAMSDVKRLDVLTSSQLVLQFDDFKAKQTEWNLRFISAAAAQRVLRRLETFSPNASVHNNPGMQAASVGA